METLLQDARYAFRMLRKSPGLTVVAVVTLALGIGANTAIFSVVNAVLLRPLRFAEPGRLITIWENDKVDGISNLGYPTFLDFQRLNHSFDKVAVSSSWLPILSGDAEAERLQGRRVSRDFFSVLRVKPLYGRDFTPEEDRRDVNRSVILSYGLWQRRFGGDRSVVGKTIQLSGRPYLVVGVLPANFEQVFDSFGEPPSIWAPLGYDLSLPYACRDCRHLQAIGRLKTGVSLNQASADLGAISRDLYRQYPTEYSQAGVILIPLQEKVVSAARTPLYALLGAVLLVLLIACANVAGLLLSRTTERSREIAVRTALGASRWRLTRQLLTEGILLCLLGGALGLCLGYWGVSGFPALADSKIPLMERVSLDWRVLAFTLGLSLLSGLFFGLAPAWHFGAAEPGETLKDRGRSSAGTKRQRLRSALVVANVAIALVLLLGAGLLLRSLGRLLNVDAGFDASNVLTANLDVGGPNYRKDPQIVAFYQQVLERIRALPGVESVGMTSQLPLGGNVDGYGVHVEGKLSPNPQNDPSADRYSVSPDYLHTMRIPVISGRAFTDADRADTQSVVLVNQTLARRMWPGEDPLGKRVKVGGLDGPWRIVVGVVGDVLHGGLDASHTNQIYLPESQFTDGTVVLVIRTAASSVNSEAAVRRAVAEVDRNQPTSKFATMDQVVLRSLAQRSFTLGLLGGFAGLALLLAAVGIYGVISYLVSLRRHEIGIRMALGASPANVQQMVLRHGLRLGAIGIGLGLATGLGAGRALSSLLFQVSPTDPLAMAGGALLLLAMALLASYIPARRAAQLDPMAALRHE
ncbi:MAG: ABC transporter permease [Acidobacteriia bacterium]|nr:ABC transporter permease [Terriglobia bacterium]